jgi:hypothetical protein
MEQLPKIVAQRLQAVSRTETHPDANLLAAFAEKSLLPREQTQVLEHLVACAECREVVAHAQPEELLQRAAVAAAAPVAGRRSSWFAGASVRWIALAACVAVVGAVVISRTQFSPSTQQAVSSNQPDVVARNEPQTSPSAPPAEESRAKASTSEVAQAKGAAAGAITLKRDADQSDEADKQQSAHTALRRFGERQQPEKSYDKLEAKSNNSPANYGVVAGTSSATQPVTVESAASPNDTKATKKEFSADKAMRAPATSNEVAQSAPAPPPPPPPVAKAAPALADSQTVTAESVTVESNYKQKDGYVSGAAIGGLAKMRAAIIPMWQLSEDGKLIKSLDHGQDWQPVPVGDKSVFQALCVTGNEIWIGGKQGNLFYSSDSGQQWEQVKPVAKGQTLTADITAIEFKDLKHGKLITADHQTWTTTDGGHDWKVESR